jgi:hypothetical protein
MAKHRTRQQRRAIDVSTETIPLPLAAQRLGTGWGTAYRLVLSGQIRGEQRGGRWQVETASLKEYEGRHVTTRPPADA